MTTTPTKPPRHQGEPIDNEVFDFTQIDSRRAVQSRLNTYGGKWRVTIKPASPRTTDPQRGFYFGVIVKIFADFIRDHDPTLSLQDARDAAHYQLKLQNLPEPIMDADGRLIATRVGSVAKIDKKVMSKLIDDCINWLGAEWSIAIPEPTHQERFGSSTVESL